MLTEKSQHSQCCLTVTRPKNLAVTRTARMAAAGTFGMTVRTSFTAIVVTLFFDGIAGIHNAQARVTGTFHLSNSRHGSLLNR